MKAKAILVLFFILFTLACKKDKDTYIKSLHNINACGKEDPLNQLEWMNKLANQSLNDKTGNYVGSIWIITYEGSDIIVTDMALGSGGTLYYFFDCNGEKSSSLASLNPSDLSNYLMDSNKVFTTINLLD